MTERFFISDTHFSHANILTFKRDDGTPLRDFPSIEAHDEFMVGEWNKLVQPQDTIYHLGDVVINRKALPLLGRLNGRKVLVRGNHDIFKLKDYTPYFDDVRGYAVFVQEGFICSHIPLHPDSLERWKANVHGHTHARSIKDPRYVCVSVEHTGFRPLHMDEVLARLPK